MIIGRRIPLQSGRPLLWFAHLRVVIVAAGLASVVAFDVPHRGRVALAVAGVALPWALWLLAQARRRPELGLSAAIAAGDLLILGLVQVAEPASYAGVRFVALFLIATHAYFQGERGGLLVAVAGIAFLVPVGALADTPIDGGMLTFSECLFAVSALCCGLFVARLRSAESAERLRARDLSRRAIEAENEVRRRLAESLHDGPVQELVSLDLMLASLDNAVARGDAQGVRDRLHEARQVTQRNIRSLRDELVGLGPYAFDELSFDIAVEQCRPVWQRRYGIDIELAVDRLDLSNEVCGALFGIAQEAVANAGRHANASRVVVTLRTVGDEVELRVSDDGDGFRGPGPLSPSTSGHIGLASMRERAELIGGRLDIETGERGTKVVARAPLRPAPASA
ncbi:MAG TPA: sensor histidine kinase [Thermoleophilaceae bacterium]|jgi:signal transduction histidine kinase